MKDYTYQVGEGPIDHVTKVIYSEVVSADRLGEAIDKAKAITLLRPVHEGETAALLFEDLREKPVWSRLITDLRNLH